MQNRGWNKEWPRNKLIQAENRRLRGENMKPVVKTEQVLSRWGWSSPVTSLFHRGIAINRVQNSAKSRLGTEKTVAIKRVLQLSGLQLSGFLYCVDIGEKNGALTFIAIIRVLQLSGFCNYPGCNYPGCNYPGLTVWCFSGGNARMKVPWLTRRRVFSRRFARPPHRRRLRKRERSRWGGCRPRNTASAFSLQIEHVVDAREDGSDWSCCNAKTNCVQ